MMLPAFEDFAGRSLAADGREAKVREFGTSARRRVSSHPVVSQADLGPATVPELTVPAPEDSTPRAPQSAGPPGNPPPGRVDRATAADIELKPLDPRELADAIQADFHYSRVRAAIHDVRAGRWDLTARWARFAVAMTAAISTLSLIADNIVITTVFSIVTAFIAAVNAAI